MAWKAHKNHCAILKYDEKRGKLPPYIPPSGRSSLNSTFKGELEGFGPMNATENRFPRKIATFEVQRHLTSLVAMAMRDHPTTPLNQIGFEVNTTVFPLQVRPFRVEAYANAKLVKDVGPCSSMTRAAAIAKDVLVTHDTFPLFVCIIPFRKSDVKVAEERATRGDVPVPSPGTTYVRCEDLKHNPLIPSDRDEVQEIVRLLRHRAARRNLPVWSDSAIRDAIDYHLAQSWSPPTEAMPKLNVEERSLVLYKSHSPRM